MTGINKVILIGNLGKDPELRYTPGGQLVASFSLAVGETWNDKQGQKKTRTEWFNVVVWGKLGELCSNYLSKGKTCYVEGKLKTTSWEDNDGNKKYKTEVDASTVQFLSQSGGAKPSENSFENETVSTPVSDEDLPF